MSLDRLSGQRGSVYEIEFAGTPSNDTLIEGSWYRVLKTRTGSILPPAGRVFRAMENISPSGEDSVESFTLNELGFSLDLSLSSNLEKIDATTQADTMKTYVLSERTESSGSLNGYFFEGSEAQDRILNRFWDRVSYDGGSYENAAKNSSEVLYLMLSRKEAGAVGASQLWYYLPVIVDSITTDKPLNGMQTFNFNFTLVGSESPHEYRHEIATA